MPHKISEDRWLIALEVERTWNINRQDIEERIKERRHTWARLLALVEDEITFDNTKRILDIGSEATSIFLSLRKGEKYAVDPLFDSLFKRHPFLKDMEEYKDVNFISSTIEKMPSLKSFDVIFTLASLDHIGELDPLVNRINELLTSRGYLVVMVDCYADPLVKKVMKFFDVELYHPHHFIYDDIIKMFSEYHLIKQQQIFNIYLDNPFATQVTKLKIYHFHRLATRMWQLLGEWGKRHDIIFAMKFFLCYSLAFSIAWLRKRDQPTHPFKKPILFIFQK